MTARNGRMAVALAASLLVGVLSLPSHAGTADDLRATKAKVAALQTELDRLAASYADAEAEFARTQQRIDGLTVRLGQLRNRMRGIQSRLAARARDAYEGGGANTLELLLTSGSFAQFSDRVEFLGRLVQDDGDLLVQARVTKEQLARTERDLRQLSLQQARTIDSLQRKKSQIASAFSRAQALRASLQRKLERERAAAAARAPSASGPSAPVRPGGALRACPVGQPRAFVDTFGAPRSGGRTHQGIDLMAPYGTPVYAAQSGRFEQNSNALGGTSALVYAAGGDYTYYAHMSSYAGVANGSTVSAGTMIGHVGNTGDARGGPYHLHFEYHPGGGAATDPYNLLKAVCG